MMESKSERLFDRLKSAADWEDRYRLLIEAGRAMAPLPPGVKTEDIKVKGCQSQVWLSANLDAEGRVVFAAESDALIVSGLVALLVEEFSRQTPDAILAKPLDFLEELSLQRHLTPSRANGLQAMIKQMRFYALAFKARQQLQRQ